MPHLPMCLLLFLCIGASALIPAKAQSDNAPFHVKVSGTGKKALLFLPGFACSGELWNETLPAFETGYRCHVFTMAGFAGVPAQQEPVLTDWVESIAGYIREKGLDHPIVIGHSLGGVMALMLAANHPELVSGIIVVDALPCLGALSNAAFAIKPDPHCDEAVERMRKTTEQQFLQTEKYVIPSLIADTVHRPDIIRWGMESDRKTYASIYCQFNNTDLRQTIKTIKCPALILLETPFYSMRSAVEGQYAGLPSARFRYATKGLHFIMFDDKQWYLNQINSFL